jgi:hypothetical protein
MATEYQYKGMGNSLPYDAFGFAVLRRRVNVPALIATDFGKLALASAPTVGLTSFTGFAGASSDILNIFHIPAGTMVISGGMRVVTSGTTSVTGELGIGGNTAALMVTATAFDAAANTVVSTLNDQAFGGDNMQGYVFAAADTIDCLFATATDILGIYDFFVVCHKVY